MIDDIPDDENNNETVTVYIADVKYLHCNNCGKQVSSGYIPVPNEIDKNNIVIRAWIECPECIENHSNDVHEEVKQILKKY